LNLAILTIIALQRLQVSGVSFELVNDRRYFMKQIIWRRE